MAVHEHTVPVVPAQQGTGYYCGPACVQMVLSSWGIAAGQDALWLDVKANTVGNRPSDALLTESSLGFPNQVCTKCSNAVTVLAPDDPAIPPNLPGMTVGDYDCWDTTARALARTVTQHAPANAAVWALHPDRFEDGVRQLIDSLDEHVPPVASIWGMNHWVTVYGYLWDESAPQTVSSAAGRPVTSLLVYDPLRPFHRTVWTLAEWREAFATIACSGDPDRNRYPIVVKAPWWLWHLAWLRRVFQRFLAWVLPG